MSIINIEISPFDYVNFSCKRGDSFERTLEVLNEDGTGFDFTDYTAKMEVRRKEGTDIIETFSTDDSTITLLDGEIVLDKETIEGMAGKYLYDLHITKDGRNTTIMTGNFVIKPDLTE